MSTEIAVDGTKFLINGRPTYEGREYEGKPIEGLLFNSRMIQAIFDDECPETRGLWAYPDTGEWDPDRNTDEFCAYLPEYRSHGLLAVTVGLQGGGGNYRPEVYENYLNSAYRPDGSFKQPYFDRLKRVLEAADDAGMAVIVNYFYWKQVRRIESDEALFDITERVTDWLLRTGHRNILVDVANESGAFWGRPAMEPENIHRLIEAVQGVSLDERRLPAGSSSGGGDSLPRGRWLATEDFSMPHGNGCTPEQLREKICRLRDMDEYRERPRPVCINEDSVFVENLRAAVEEYASWGFYCQGYGSDYRDRTDWTTEGREGSYEKLSGYQTPPVNWTINTPIKRRFFEALREITGGE
ncbi:MAG: hypothetical protein PVJ27_01855 [Candidatus Brocadiaceae bacterium]|jgi:hypothetical protein